MLEKVQADRKAKLDKLRELGVDPYGVRYDTAEEISAIFDRYIDDQEGQQADAAGRLVLIRDMGKMIFAHLRDDTAQMQIALRKNAMDENSWQVAKNLDLGDIIAVSGPLQRTKTGEVTIWADKMTFLCKSLNPMPEKFHGLQDVETRYRQRYLDLMTNPQVMDNFKTRIALLDHFRTLLKSKGFLEVETPMLQSICGGAAARPFITHNNALDIDLFMRISPELYLKRLLVGGMRKVFEINRNFRNEGVDTSHNPEFTLMELYQAYADYEVMMDITEELIATAAVEICVPKLKKQCENLRKKIESAQQSDREDKAQRLAELEDVSGPLFKAEKICDSGGVALPYGTNVINYTTPWQRKTYAELLKEHAGVEMTDMEAVRAKARELHIEENGKADAVVINELFEEAVEPYLIQPIFVKDYPADLCPLTRRKADEPSIALRFEMYMANMEIANAYTELNDPEIQHDNFASQLAGEEDGETMRSMDEDFITAQRHGMPPAGGLGIGIDRVVMLLTNTQSIRDVILFPLLKPEV